MLNQLKETDFYLLKQISTGRLRPSQMVGFFWGAFIFSGIMALVSYNAARGLLTSNPLWPILIKVIIGILVIQFLFTLFFTSDKNAYRYQKLQAYLLAFILFKLSIEMYLVYFLACEDRYAPTYMLTIGLLFLVGGFVFLIISTLRGIRRVKQGEFRENGKGLYNFQQSKGYVSLPIIYVASIFAGLMAKSLSSMDLSTVGEVIFPLLISVFIQYSIAIVWPEFFLLVYCKKRFQSYNEIPNRYR